MSADPLIRKAYRRLWDRITGPSLAVKQEAGCLKIVPSPRRISLYVPCPLSFKRRVASWLRRFFHCRLDVAMMALPTRSEIEQKGIDAWHVLRPSECHCADDGAESINLP